VQATPVAKLGLTIVVKLALNGLCADSTVREDDVHFEAFPWFRLAAIRFSRMAVQVGDFR
jgi:hypothetical protein